MEAWEHWDFVWSCFFLGGWNDGSEHSSKIYIYICIYVYTYSKWTWMVPVFAFFLKFPEWLNAFSAFGPIEGTIIIQRKARAKPQIFGTFRGASATWEESAPGGRSQLPWIPWSSFKGDLKVLGFYRVFLTIQFLGGGNSNIVYFHPENWGRWTHFDDHIFQMGWFNHQLNFCLGESCFTFFFLLHLKQHLI